MNPAWKISFTASCATRGSSAVVTVPKFAAPNTAPGAPKFVVSNRLKISGGSRVRVDGLLGQVRLRIGDQILTAVITSDALSELKLRRGDDAVAIVKSTEVMIAREAALPDAPPPPRRRPARRSTVRR